MLFVGKCACLKYGTWHHREISSDSLRVVAPDEVHFCDYNSSKKQIGRGKSAWHAEEKLCWKKV